MNPESQLINIMSTPIGTKTQQYRKPYRPSAKQVNKIYQLLNGLIFDHSLSRPEILLKRERIVLGYCKGYYHTISKGTRCKIRIPDKFYCVQWLVMILAHEMCHQYQWDIIGNQRIQQGKQRLLSHGPSFFRHKEKLAKFGIPLSKTVCVPAWFQYQDLKKL